MRWVLGLVAFSMACVQLTKSTGSTRSSFSASQLEHIMLSDKSDRQHFRTHCGSRWHQLFTSWEDQQRRALTADPTVKVIVWRCHEVCGGLGDRQRGILTSFALALVTGRAFFIDSPHPVPLHHYFHPASPDLHWAFEDRLLTNRSVFEESFMDMFPSIGDYASANLSFYDPYDVVIQKNNFWKPLSILQNPFLRSRRLLHSYDTHVLAGCLLNYLLVPARQLQSRVQQMKTTQANNAKSILALQIRSGDNQVKNATVLNELINSFETCLASVSEASRTIYTVFLTTDSDEVRVRFKQTYPELLEFPGPIAHIDGFFGLQGSPDLAFQKVVLDHIMISQSHQLVISRSGFAEFAAIRGFKSYFIPPLCSHDVRVPHYSFPVDLQAGVPATQLNSLQDILQPSFEGRVAM